jgi:prevent-host-death family protein
MKTIELDAATESLAEYAREVGEGPVILTLNGKPVAALVAIEDTDLESLSLSTHPQFVTLIERSRARLQTEGGISSDEMRRRLGLVG